MSDEQRLQEVLAKIDALEASLISLTSEFNRRADALQDLLDLQLDYKETLEERLRPTPAYSEGERLDSGH